MTLSFDPPILKTTVSAPTPLSAGPKEIQLPGTQCRIHPQVSLAKLTSFRVGGRAQWFASPRNFDDLEACFLWYQREGLPLTLLGAGSNLLISDQGLEGLVLSTKHLRFRHLDQEQGQITASAGEPLASLAWRAAKMGCHGLEWAVGIPGSLGGSVVMNAGAHQSCMADVVTSVKVLNPDGTIELLGNQDLDYRYRTSNLQGDRRLVLEATLQLEPGHRKEAVKTLTSRNLNQRKNSQPYHLPSCGSVFRNPYPHAAGRLIEELGLKGYQIGGAQVAHRHANFILNCGNATARDIFSLIQYVQDQVEQQWSLLLEPEVRFLGNF